MGHLLSEFVNIFYWYLLEIHVLNLNFLFKAGLLADANITHSIDDRSGSIGKRYARADEIGIKYAITLDYETLEDSETVTVRERDSMKQTRVKVW
jgi:glycyl-tRNA synthetase (class II)